MSRNCKLQPKEQSYQLSAKRSYTRNDGQLSARAYSIVGRANKRSIMSFRFRLPKFQSRNQRNKVIRKTQLSQKRGKYTGNDGQLSARAQNARNSFWRDQEGGCAIAYARLGNSTGEHKFCISDENVEKQKLGLWKLRKNRNRIANKSN